MDTKRPAHQPAHLLDPKQSFAGLTIPHTLARSNSISPSVKLVWSRLYEIWRAGTAWPKMEALAYDVGLSLSQIKRVLDELEEQKLIKKESPKGADRLAHRSSKYALLAHQALLPLALGQNGTSGRVKMTPPGGSSSTGARREVLPLTEGVIRRGRNEIQRRNDGGQRWVFQPQNVTDEDTAAALTASDMSFSLRTGDNLILTENDQKTLMRIADVYEPAGLVALMTTWLKKDGRRPRWNRDVRHPVPAFSASVDQLVDDPGWRALREEGRKKVPSYFK